jgi:hypothetical protein
MDSFKIACKNKFLKFNWITLNHVT